MATADTADAEAVVFNPLTAGLPTKERVMDDVVMPSRRLLSGADMWIAPGLPNHETMRQHFIVEGKLAFPDAMLIVNLAKEIFRAEPNLLELDAPLTGMPFSYCSTEALFCCSVSLRRYSRPVLRSHEAI